MIKCYKTNGEYFVKWFETAFDDRGGASGGLLLHKADELGEALAGAVEALEMEANIAFGRGALFQHIVDDCEMVRKMVNALYFIECLNLDSATYKRPTEFFIENGEYMARRAGERKAVSLPLDEL